MAAVAAAAMLASACTRVVSDVPARLPSRVRGWLHVDGQRIVDDAGRTVDLRGIQVPGMASGSGYPRRDLPAGACGGWSTPGPATYDSIARWGFNFVRVGISWSNLEPTPPLGVGSGPPVHHYNAGYVEALDRLIHQFSVRGVAVVLEMAQSKWSPAFKNVPTSTGVVCEGYGMPGWLYPSTGITIPQAKLSFFGSPEVQDEYGAAWRFIAQRYSTDPSVVGLDLVNEPYLPRKLSPTLLHLDDFYLRLGAAIRSVNQRALLLFQDSSSAPDVPSGLTRPPPFAGVVYTFHLYTPRWRPEGLGLMQSYQARARAWKVPLLMTEFNAFGYASTHDSNPDWTAQVGQLLAYCRQQGVGWSFHGYGGGKLLIPDTNRTRPGLLPAIQAGF